MNLATLEQKYHNCTMCPLHAERTQVVMGEGNPHSPLMLVGEGPGRDEDRLGRPFVGRAGKLLDAILEAAEIPRSKIYISNIVKCRPPGNRTPTDDEMGTCISILREQFCVIGPKIIVTLGAAATRAMIDQKSKISQVRGKWVERGGVRFLPTYHPAYLLRNPAGKQDAWADFQLIRDAYKAILASEAHKQNTFAG